MSKGASTIRISNIDGSCYQWHGDHGPVIVLIHGLGLNKEMWRWQIPQLSESHRVLSYDLYGHGRSPRASQRHSLALFAQQLIGLLDEAEIDSCGIAGFSLGGMIARRCAMDYPQRVSALAILNSPHARSDEQQQAIMERVKQVSKQGPAATVDAAIKRWFTDDYHDANPEVINLVRQWVLANDPDVYPENYAVLAMGVNELVAPQPPIECPTLVVAAEHDFGQPVEMADAIAAEIPNAHVKLIPKLRHMALVEAPDQYNQMLQSFFDKAFSDYAIADKTNGGQVSGVQNLAGDNSDK